MLVVSVSTDAILFWWKAKESQSVLVNITQGIKERMKWWMQVENI